MFDKWKAARDEQRKRDAEIQANDYLRRLRNSASMLSGLSPSVNGEELDHTLEIYEIRAILRKELESAQGMGERHG